MGPTTFRDQYADQIIWFGVIVGIPAWILDMIYVSNVDFKSAVLKAFCVIFLIT